VTEFATGVGHSIWPGTQVAGVRRVIENFWGDGSEASPDLFRSATQRPATTKAAGAEQIATFATKIATERS
jgi:hypothetical protein